MHGCMPVVLPFAETELNFPPRNVRIDGDVCTFHKRGAGTVNKYQPIRYSVNFIASSTQCLFRVKILHLPGGHDAEHRVVRQFVFDFCIQLSGQDCQIICMDDKLGMREQCKDLRLIGTGVAFNRHNGFAAACTQGAQFLLYGIRSTRSMGGGADLYGGEAPVRVSRGIRHKRHLLSDILYDIINIHGSGINVNTFLNKIKISNYIFTSCRLHGILDSEVLCGINLRCDNVFARRTPETAHQQGGQI